VIVSPERLGRAVRELLVRAGCEPAEAALVADHLVESNLQGHDSHGVGMIPRYVDDLLAGTLRPNTGVRLLEDGGAFMRFSGDMGFGQRVAMELMEQLVARAREAGAVVATLRDVYHLGRVGTYAEHAVAAGCASVHFVSVTGHAPFVVPHRGVEARFTTNPVCVGFPGGERHPPLLVDMATAAVALGKVRVAHNAGVPLEPGVALDADGRPTTDPGALYPDAGQPRGALLPFGAHKGYCLLFAAEVLAGILGGGGAGHPANQGRGTIVNSMLTVVVDPARFVDRVWLDAEYDTFREYVLSSRPADPAAPVLAPGDPERITKAQRLAGGIPIDDASWREIVAAGESVGLPGSELESLAGA
jgi:uncharacterized oxidoreductase